MNKEIKAYIAGFFDADGTVGRYKYCASKNGKPYFRLHARITQKNPEVLCWIQNMLGYGKIYGLRDNTIYELHFVYRQAERFLNSILPYLRVKQERAKKALKEQYG